MTRTELYSILRRYLLTDGVAQHALSQIWGQPFDGETEKITKKDEVNTTKSASSTSAATEESSVAAAIGNEADFVTKSMTEDEIVAAKMARDLRQIREQILYLGKYQTNLIEGGGWDTLVRMDADAEKLESHLRRRWNTPTPNPHNQ